MVVLSLFLILSLFRHTSLGKLNYLSYLATIIAIWILGHGSNLKLINYCGCPGYTLSYETSLSVFKDETTVGHFLIASFSYVRN